MQHACSLAGSTTVSCDACVRLAVDLGMFEAAVCDALTGQDGDSLHPVSATLRSVTTQAAHAYLAALDCDLASMRAWAARTEALLAGLDLQATPPQVLLRKPEGFAYYGLYPEMYLDAVAEAISGGRPQHAACVGIRSIGTTLSAFVVAALERRGCTVATWTLRPTGHPFDRRVRIADDLVRLLTVPQPDVAFIADEGPGLSGSSFAAGAEALQQIGIPPDHIVLLPAWLPDGDAFMSRRAAESWRRLRKITVPFERGWIDNGRLASVFDATHLEDISAGRWRKVWRGADAATVQPQHERRKYLVRDAEQGVRCRRLIKFAGLGRFGDALVARAERLDRAPIARPARLTAGFVAHQVIDGVPMNAGAVDREFLATAGGYLVTVARQCATDVPADPESLAPMLETNACELLPGAALPELAVLMREVSNLPAAPAVQLDARMQPHEWLRTRRGYVKVDALEHHDDHFFPGPQDIAWDLASTIVEFELGQDAASFLAGTVAAQLGDPTLDRRLPFYTAAYLAFRAGYCSVGAITLGESDDGVRLASAGARYTSRLRALLERR